MLRQFLFFNMCATIQSKLQCSNTVPAYATTPLGTVQHGTATGHSHAYLMFTIEVSPTAQCPLSTASDMLKSKLPSVWQVTVCGDSGTSNHQSWGGCAVFCVFFHSCFLSFFFFLMVFFPLNGQSLVWKVAKPEINTLTVLFFKRGNTERWGEGLRQVTMNANTLHCHYQALDFQFRSSSQISSFPVHWTCLNEVNSQQTEHKGI